MEPTYNPVKIRFVFEVRESEQYSFTGRKKKQLVPTGASHLFRYSMDAKKNIELFAYSLCGRSRSEIGTITKDREINPLSRVCEECQAIYKTMPDSPWKAFVNGEGIKA